MVQHEDIDHTGLTGIGGIPAAALITDTLLGSDTASFDFTSIPGTYKHLQLVFSGRSTRASNIDDFIRVRFNNDSGSNYDCLFCQFFSGSSSAAFTQDLAATGLDHFGYIPGATGTAGRTGIGTIWIPDYASATLQKAATFDGYMAYGTASTNIRKVQSGGNWRSTAAITRVTLTSFNSANFLAGSRCSLYGVG